MQTKFKKWFIKLTLMTLIVSGLMACECIDNEKSENPKATHTYKKPKNNRHHGLWERLRKNMHITSKHKHAVEQQRIQQFVKHYSANEKQMTKISKASPYLHYIVEELEKRNMPSELALLPMIESSFEPQATSRKGAAGLWQFMGRTGKEYGLQQDKWYDGRRDITASTKAALDYLQFLHEEYKGNWMLALAAYNAGPGTVNRAIKKNIMAGKPTNFWDLKLPKETEHYVPKFLALVEVIKNPDKHQIDLPKIEDKPYFVPVNSSKYLTFNRVSKLAEINVNELKRLNPGYKRQSTHPKGPTVLLLPKENADKLKENLITDTIVEIPPKDIVAVTKIKAAAKKGATKAKTKGKSKAKTPVKAKAAVKAKPKAKASQAKARQTKLKQAKATKQKTEAKIKNMVKTHTGLNAKINSKSSKKVSKA